jgi:hypothetical protein
LSIIFLGITPTLDEGVLRLRDNLLCHHFQPIS